MLFRSRQAKTTAAKFPCEKSICTGGNADFGTDGMCKLAANSGKCADSALGSCAYRREWTIRPRCDDGRLGQSGQDAAGAACAITDDELSFDGSTDDACTGGATGTCVYTAGVGVGTVGTALTAGDKLVTSKGTYAPQITLGNGRTAEQWRAMHAVNE